MLYNTTDILAQCHSSRVPSEDQTNKLVCEKLANLQSMAQPPTIDIIVKVELDFTQKHLLFSKGYQLDISPVYSSSDVRKFEEQQQYKVGFHLVGENTFWKT